MKRGTIIRGWSKAMYISLSASKYYSESASFFKGDKVGIILEVDENSVRVLVDGKVGWTSWSYLREVE